ncbi:MAG TPA: hypothetical protein VL282_07515 [Tepidisphaeraceae bacterium]|jgi:hypothetical protein|nr:hypothetical protein [Tepidisphaeraceae bacterium]
MREERGQITGGAVIYEPIELWGSIAGKVRVIAGGKLYVRGAIYGDLIVEAGGRVHVFGRVTGKMIVYQGAKVIHSGILGKDAINKGGRLYVESIAQVGGKVKHKKGDTVVEPRNKPTLGGDWSAFQ